jgi:hypothetical protein
MSENTAALEIEDVETEDLTLSLEDVVREIVGTEGPFTPYKISTFVNKVFEVSGLDKRIPPQMMYTYVKNGLIVKGVKDRKSYTVEETVAFVTRYTSKHLNK